MIICYLDCDTSRFFKRQYVGANKGKIVTTLNPSAATYHQDEKEAKEWLNKYAPTLLKHVNFSELKPQWVKEFQDWINNGYIIEMFQPENELLNMKYNPDTHTKTDVLKYFYNLREFGTEGISHENMNSWPKPFILFKTIWSISINKEIDIHSTLYANVKATFEEFEEELNILLSISDLHHANSPEDSNEKYVFAVFDDEYAIYDSYRFIIFQDNTYGFRGSRTFRGAYLFKSKSLEKMFKWWQQNYPYS